VKVRKLSLLDEEMLNQIIDADGDKLINDASCSTTRKGESESEIVNLLSDSKK
jgi:hypothetical protein